MNWHQTRSIARAVLPDASNREINQITEAMMADQKPDSEFAGMHLSHPHGPFEVFHHDEKRDPVLGEPPMETGWYWWPCHPGCLPDADPMGPFPTAEGAYLDAIND